jgi:ABC-type glycerol-3-phosphate transport system substrate-binding protein
VPHRAAGRPRPAPVAIALLALGLATAACSGQTTSTPAAEPVTLRLQVSLTPEELATFQPAIEALDAAHPEWVVALRRCPRAPRSRR